MTEQAEKNRALAEALGYDVESFRTQFVPNHDMVWMGLSPNGDWLSEYYKGSEAEAWALAPDFYNSVDAVLATLPEDNYLYDLTFLEKVAGGHIAKIYRDAPPMGYVAYWEGEGNTRAWALAEARLAMAQADGASGEGG